MKITHVICGEKRISNTSYKIVIRESFGFDIYKIKFGHISLIEGKMEKNFLSVSNFTTIYSKLS